MTLNNRYLHFSLFACLPLATGCLPASDVVDTGGGTAVIDIPTDQFPGDPSNTVCDPFSNNPGHVGYDLSHGIVANIKYLLDSSPRYSNVMDYQSYGEPISATLFLSELNVPTRPFSLGFNTEGGTLIVNQSGNTLYEYFSIHFETQIKLTSTNPTGLYQFAVISDDGSITQIDTGSGYRTLLNNDNVHASRFTAATTPVSFTSRDTAFPLKVDYFQGPRYHIAMVLLWRPWPSGSAIDPLEGASGNSLFFNPDNNSAPTQNYANLLARGWAPVPAANFILPSNVAQNPCNIASTVTTSIIGKTPSDPVTNQTHMTFSFESNTANPTFNCSLDSNPLSSCVSPLSYSGLSAGSHTFKVFASANGRTDSTGASYSWTVTPTTSITSASPSTAMTNKTSMTFHFAANSPNSTFKCSLDNAAQTSCSSPRTYSGLSDGAHIFKVFATSGGQTDATGASYAWTIDTVLPNISANVIALAKDSFTIQWSTDKFTTTRLSWGLTNSTPLPNGIPEDMNLTRDHIVMVPNLNASTFYFYSFGGSDEAGNSVGGVDSNGVPIDSGVRRLRTTAQ